MPTRKARGRRSEQLVAAELQALWPHAHPVGAGAPGRDIHQTPGVAVEVKSRRSLDLPGWLRQAHRNAGPDLPVLVVRPDGMGETSVPEWAAVLTLAALLGLLRDAGYGTHPEDQPA